MSGQLLGHSTPLNRILIISVVTEYVLVQAASGVTSFCKIILVLRALLQHYRLAPVLDLLLDHIQFEEFVLAGASSSLEPLSCTLHALCAIRRAWHLCCGGFCGFPVKVKKFPSRSATLRTCIEFVQAMWSSCLPEKLL